MSLQATAPGADSRPGPSRTIRIALIVGTVAYLLLLAARSSTTAPDYDETLVGNPACNLARHGFMGTTNLYRPEWPGIERYTFNTLPGSILLTALVFHFTDCSVFFVRLVPMLFAMLGLTSIYGIVVQLTASRGRALLAVILVALDYNYILTATNAHPDMMQVSLGLAAQATYLYLRSSSLSLATFASSALIVCAGITHPNAAFFAGFLGFLIIRLDRSRLNLRCLIAGALPFAAGFAGWSQYLMRAPVGARAQLAANASLSYDIGSFLQHPFDMLISELQVRYLRAPGPYGVLLAPVKIPFALIYAGAVTALVLWRPARRDRASIFFFGEALLLFGFFAFCQGVKDIYGYTADVISFLLMATSGILCALWTRNRKLAIVAACLIAGGDSLGLAHIGRSIADNPNRNEVEAGVTFLRSAARPSDLLALPFPWGFSYGFDAPSVQWDSRFASHPKFMVIRIAFASPEGINDLLADLPPDRERPAARDFFENADVVFRAGTVVIFRRRDPPGLKQ